MAGTLIYDASAGRYQYVIGGSSSQAKSVKKVVTIAERDALKDKTTDVMVMEAYRDDPTVETGWAIYTYVESSGTWVKIGEQESMDITVSLTGLGFTKTAQEYNAAGDNSHSHVTVGNVKNTSVLYAAYEGNVNFTAFTQVSLPEFDEVSEFRALYQKAVYIGDGEPYYIESSSFTNNSNKFTGVSISVNDSIIDENTRLTNVTQITGSIDTLAVIDSGKLYVVAIPNRGGSSVMYPKKTTDATFQAGKLYYTRTSFNGTTSYIYTRAYVTAGETRTGDYYEGGIAKCGTLLGDNQYSIPGTAYTQVGTDSNWEQIGALNLAWAAIKGDGNNGHVLYMAGVNVCYQLGTAAYPNTSDLVQTAKIDNELAGFTTASFGKVPYYLNEFKPITVVENNVRVIPTDWLDFSLGGYYTMARRGNGTTVTYNGVTFKKGTLWLWGQNHDGCLGDGYHTMHDMTSADVTNFKDPDGNDYPEGTTPCEVGRAEPKPLACIVDNSEVVYDDWVDYSAGWYHAVALRYVDKGNGVYESEVYLWGSNEYGCLGNGNYLNYRLQEDGTYEVSEDGIEYVDRPRLLTTAEFPYKDVVAVRANHYAVILVRANGEAYYAGCNKRNQLGITAAGGDAVNLATFTKMSSFFKDAYWDAETYGGFVLRDVPYLTDAADPIYKNIFTGDMSLNKIANAVTNSHTHVASTDDIDAVVLSAKQFLGNYEAVLSNLHSNPANGWHTNMSVLNKLSASGNTLLFNGNPIEGSGGGSGSGVVVDPSNRPLDDTVDVTGFNNIAGGMPLEVISYNPTTTAVGFAMRVSPSGGQYHNVSRWLSLGTKNTAGTFTELISVADQAKGLIAVMSTASTINKIINCTADIKTYLTTIRDASSNPATLSLYYIDVDANGWKRGSKYKDITQANLKGGSIASIVFATADSSEYLPLDDMPSAGLNENYDETEQWIDLYDSNHNVVFDGADAESAANAGTPYYFNDGTQNTTEVTCSAEICIPKGHDGSTPVYHKVVDSNGDTVITAEAIAAGLFKKEGSSYNKITTRDIPEKFNEALFTTGEIYIHPSKSDFTSLANQKYAYNPAYTQFLYKYKTTTDTTFQSGKKYFTLNSTMNVYVQTNVTAGATRSGTYYEEDGVESVILLLTSEVGSDANTSTSDGFNPGSVEDPMMAVIPSEYRGYSASVSGEYNSAIGFNTTVAGNSNDVFGHFSQTTGLSNIVVGMSSVAYGDSNTVAATESFCVGSANIVGGDRNSVFGLANHTYGYYGFVYGSRNFTYGVDAFVVGNSNHAIGSRAYVIGQQIKVLKNANDVMAIGYGLDISAEKAIVIGRNADVPKYVGTNVPSDDTSVIATMTAAQYTNAGYDQLFISNKEGIFFGDGMKNGQNKTTVFPASFTKYRVRPNPAYFNATATASARSSIDPYLFEPYMQWGFVGAMHMYFTDPTQVGSTSDFTFTKRDGGRVKTFDAGVAVGNLSSAQTVVLDFDKATRWKLGAANASATSALMSVEAHNFVDGAEAYIVLYARANVSWSSLTETTSTALGVNKFTSVEWVGGSAINASSNTSGFALLKLMVVDNTLIIEILVNKLS